MIFTGIQYFNYLNKLIYKNLHQRNYFEIGNMLFLLLFINDLLELNQSVTYKEKQKLCMFSKY